jgi:hypothetical protein
MGLFQATRHRHLLATDDSIIEPYEADFGDIELMDETDALERRLLTSAY